MELEFKFDLSGKEISLSHLKKALNISNSRAKQIKQEFWRKMAREATLAIKSMDFQENAQLTIDLKGDDKPPLYETGKLFDLIKITQINQHAAKIGISPAHKDYRIYKAIHNGVRIEVTEKMRSMFEFLAMASNGVISPSKLTGRAAELFKKKNSGWKSLDHNTKHIVIPPRPFMRYLFRNPEFKEKFRKNAQNIVRDYLEEIKRRAK